MKFSLQTQIFTAIFLLTSLFAAVLSINVSRFERGLEDQRNLTIAREVTIRSADLERHGRLYATVAPREFESYGRDVQLFYPNLQADLVELATAVIALEAINTNAAAVAELSRKHQQFTTGLAEKLGNPAEPRLEWGAEFLASETPLLRETAQMLETTLADTANAHFAEAQQLVRWSWLLGAVAIGIILLWFWRRVTRRIGGAATSCTQVAEGDFGTRIDDPSHDEIGQFSAAFNGLSTRTRVVLGVLDQLPADASSAQAFDTLWQESHDYLGHQWQAMFDVDADLRGGKLRALSQDSGEQFAAIGDEFALAGIADQLSLANNGQALWPDVRRHTLDPTQGKLLRELSMQELRTVVFVLLKDDQGQVNRVLAFAWKDANAQKAGVANFLGSLSRFLGRLLAGSQQLPASQLNVVRLPGSQAR